MSPSRRNSCKVPISIREWLVCAFSALTLVFTAWSLGGYENWALHLLFLGGLTTFLLSVVPMPRSWNGFDQQHGNLKNFKRLLAQPFFWVSLCFLGYILIQYFNPSIVQVFSEKSWWVEPMIPPLGSRLPTSVKADYHTMNALRTFVIHASAITLACGILVGIQRRKTALIILWSFVTSAVAMSFVAILQKLSGTEKLIWLVDVANANPWGTFAYRNQATAFLILVLLISGLLYLFYERQSLRKLKTSGPHLLIFLFILILSGSIWLSLSRSGIILGVFLFGLFLILALLNALSAGINFKIWTTVGTFFILLCFGIIFISELSDWQEFNDRSAKLEIIIKDIESYDRYLTSKATWEMFQDRSMYGWGAGSFRYIFPIYQKEYEELWYFHDHRKQPYGRKIYNYAHNDWMQFLAEYGIVGGILLACVFLGSFAYLWSVFKVSLISACLLLFGIMIIYINNFVDFIFSSPSYWVAFFGALALTGKLHHFELKSKELIE